MSSGLLDIHVLEETTSRVSALTKSIDKQVGIVEELTSGAHQAVRTSARGTNRDHGHFRSNAAAVLEVYEHVEQATRRVSDLNEPIHQGVEAVGWDAYIAIVAAAQSVHSDLTMQPELQRFPQLADGAYSVFEDGQSNLRRYFKRLCKGVFKAPTASEQDELPPPELSYGDIHTLAKLLESLSQFPETERATDQYVLQVMDTYLTKCTEPALSRKPPPPTQEFQAYVGDVRASLLSAVEVLYASDSSKQRQAARAVDEFAQRESKHGVEVLEKPRPRANAPALGINTQVAARQGQMSAGPLSAGPMSPGAANNKMVPTTPGGPKSSVEALRGPQIATTPRSSRQGGTPTVGVTPGTPMAVPGTPGAAGAHPGTPGTPGNPIGTPYASQPGGGAYSPKPASSSSASNPAGSTSSGPINTSTPNWMCLEVLDTVRSGVDLPADEIARNKREGLTLLMQVFVDIDQQCRKSPITSEFGVSGASIQFLKTLQNVATTARGVEVVLSELPTRGYLAKPPPAWAARAEPTPAARADPVSLYFADCIDCLYANLSQVSSDQLKEPTKRGLFLLSNLAAVEHFITDSNTETLATLRARRAPNTPMMDTMGEVALQRFGKDVDAAFKLYLTEWNKLAPNLLDATLTGTAMNAKLSGKDREQVKEKFRVFNAEFDQLAERQKRFPVPDPTLRARISQEVRKLIVPLYTRFYMKHKDGDFTKNIAKYVKYTPPEIENAVTF